MNHYFLITTFPPLTLGVQPEISFKELESLLALNLPPSDLKKVDELLEPVDLYNIRAFWLGMPLDDRGRIRAKELEEALLVQEGLPPYVIEYLERYDTTEERLRYFSSLYVSMYRHLIANSKGFLLKWFQFDREFRLVLAALRAKAFGLDLIREFQFEDPTDPFVLEIISQKDVPDFTPPKEFEDLKALFTTFSSNPKELNQAILEYQFRKIEEMEEPQDFGIDRVLAYMQKFFLVESLALLDKQKGMEQLSHYE